MSKSERLKEQIGWLKVVFGLFVGADFALLGWLAQNFKSDLALYCLIAIVIISIIVALINRSAMKKIDELEEL
ncbi:MAG: hypothetical protein PHE67_06790 [Campylobacterales bacterium]|nr:hypothetical protein [Campylobacterales bacterium]